MRPWLIALALLATAFADTARADDWPGVRQRLGNAERALGLSATWPSCPPAGAACEWTQAKQRLTQIHDALGKHGPDDDLPPAVLNCAAAPSSSCSTDLLCDDLSIVETEVEDQTHVAPAHPQASCAPRLEPSANVPTNPSSTAPILTPLASLVFWAGAAIALAAVTIFVRSLSSRGRGQGAPEQDAKTTGPEATPIISPGKKEPGPEFVPHAMGPNDEEIPTDTKAAHINTVQNHTVSTTAEAPSTPLREAFARADPPDPTTTVAPMPDSSPPSVDYDVRAWLNAVAPTRNVDPLMRVLAAGSAAQARAYPRLEGAKAEMAALIELLAIHAAVDWNGVAVIEATRRLLTRRLGEQARLICPARGERYDPSRHEAVSGDGGSITLVCRPGFAASGAHAEADFKAQVFRD